MLALDLFCGGGGVGVALDRMGYSVLGVDNVADCLATCFQAGHRTRKWDLQNRFPISEAFDLVWASPPCTAFSVAGKRSALQWSGHLTRAVAQEDWEWGRRKNLDPTIWLILPALQTILYARPRVVAIENVQQATPALEAGLRVLRRYGYGGQVGLLSAEQFGLPQTRKRAFLVARLGGECSLPTPTHREYVNPTYNVKVVEKAKRDFDLLPWRSMAEALKLDERTLNTGRDWKEEGGRATAQSVSLDQPAPTVSAQAGRQWVWLFTGERNATNRSIHEPSPTVSFGHNSASWTIASEQLTVEQTGLLQGFPIDHPWQGSKTSIFRKIGNAVPPPMAMAVIGAGSGGGWHDLVAAYLKELYG
jgi:DNA (cytosine-5)-methyltransferase 1